MSIAPPRYAAESIQRVGRGYRTLAIFSREVAARAGWGTWIVIAFAYLTNVLVLLLTVELSPPGTVTLSTFFAPFAVGLWPYEILLVTAATGAGVIAEDVASRSISLYLSRPIHLNDYLAGKAAGVAFWIGVVAIGPGLLGVTFVGLLGGATATDVLQATGAFLVVGFLASLFFTALALALSAWTSRALYAGVAIFGLILALQIAAAAIGGITGNPQVFYVAPFTDLQSIAQVAFQTQQTTSTDPTWSAALLLLASAALGAATWARLERIEVVGE